MSANNLLEINLKIARHLHAIILPVMQFSSHFYRPVSSLTSTLVILDEYTTGFLDVSLKLIQCVFMQRVKIVYTCCKISVLQRESSSDEVSGRTFSFLFLG